MYTVEQVISFYEDLTVAEKSQVKAYIETTVPGQSSGNTVTILDAFTGESRNIVSAIKSLRAAKGYGLKEAKSLIDSRPSVIPFDTSNEAEAFAMALEDAGFAAKVG